MNRQELYDALFDLLQKSAFTDVGMEKMQTIVQVLTDEEVVKYNDIIRVQLMGSLDEGHLLDFISDVLHDFSLLKTQRITITDQTDPLFVLASIKMQKAMEREYGDRWDSLIF